MTQNHNRIFRLLANYGFGWRKVGIMTSTMEDMTHEAQRYRLENPSDDLAVDLDSEEPMECGRQATWARDKKIEWPQ